MFENYTKSARNTIFFARYEVSQFGGPFLEPHHLLIGLLRAESRLARAFGLTINERTGIDLSPIRQKIASLTTPGAKIDPEIDIPLSETTKKVFAFAADESERLRHRHVDTVHIFLGLVKEGGEVVAQILRERSLYPENTQAYDRMALLLDRTPRPPQTRIRRSKTAVFIPTPELSLVMTRASEIAGIPVSLESLLLTAAALFPRAILEAAELIAKPPERKENIKPRPSPLPPDSFEA